MTGSVQVIMSSNINNVSEHIDQNQSHQIDIDKVFSSRTLRKYPPDAQNYKYYITGMLIFIVILAITAIGISSSSSSGSSDKDQSTAAQARSLLNFPISGTYQLNNHDGQFENYLASLDIHHLAIQSIKEVKEIITVQEPTRTNPNWTFTYKTGMRSCVSQKHKCCVRKRNQLSLQSLIAMM